MPIAAGNLKHKRGYKTQMGTIISDSSHFTAINRSFLQCQVTVIVAGELP